MINAKEAQKQSEENRQPKETAELIGIMAGIEYAIKQGEFKTRQAIYYTQSLEILKDLGYEIVGGSNYYDISWERA